ncbi:unnamed protein product [Brachionus calyciflorus]|uniref:Uncharacterized protein n=1 Tax=Brachionus calyciflorus TaxID=104777 RepID=A0A814DLT0_9BILA|nr:unnamed protein product [Brachionus calyciflorus]
MLICLSLLLPCFLILGQIKADECIVDNENNSTRHNLITNLDDLNLNERFKLRVDCAVKDFTLGFDDLKTSFQNALDNSKTNQTSVTEGKKRKNNKSKDASNSHNFAQIGFVFYSLNETQRVTYFDHESFIFTKTQSNVTSTDFEIAELSNDIIVLKALYEDIKHKLKVKQKNLSQMKGSKKNKTSKKHSKHD